MKFLVRGFVKWLIRIGLVLNLILWLAVVQIYCQHEKHDNTPDMEDDIRIKSVIFLNVDKETIYFKRETKYRIDLGSFIFDDKTIWDRSKPTPPCMVAIFCVTHSYLYAFYSCKK